MGKEHLINQSLLRKPTFLGVDRELCMLLSLVCLVVAFYSWSFNLALIVALVFVFGYYCLFCISKYDPNFRQVYLKNIRYQKVYVAKPYLMQEIYKKR